MDDIVPPPPLPSTRSTTPSLRRRNSIATSLSLPSLPTRLAAVHSTTTITSSGAIGTTSASSTSSGDLEFISIIKPSSSSSSYTSIRDLLPFPAAVHSPTPSSSAASGYEISIRNRLVKQAAWAYLQPMSTSPESVAGSFIHRIWFRISGDLVMTPVVALFRFIVDWILRAFRVQSSR